MAISGYVAVMLDAYHPSYRFTLYLDYSREQNVKNQHLLLAGIFTTR